MIEILLTSFPFAIRVAWLRWRGLPVTFYNVHRAVFTWLVLALAVFFAVFYYYPKSYTGIVTFRSVPVVAELGGNVTQLNVRGGDRVEAGDILFTVENSGERADVEIAERRIDELKSALDAARIDVRTAKAVVAGAESAVAQSELALADQLELQERDSAAFQLSKLERAQNLRESRLAGLQAAQSKLQSAMFRVESVLPAQLARAEAELDDAKAELAKTTIFSPVSGIVEQLTLNVGARASRLAARPSMVIVPDRASDEPFRVQAGFSQVTRSVLHEGMAAEVACEANFNIAMYNTVLPARIARLQTVVSSGQLTPTGQLIEPAERARRGDIVAHLEIVHPEHHDILVPGSGCMVQVYTTHVTGSLEGGLIAHGIEALGVLKAILLRVKAWIALAVGIGLGGGGH